MNQHRRAARAVCGKVASATCLGLASIAFGMLHGFTDSPAVAQSVLDTTRDVTLERSRIGLEPDTKRPIAAGSRVEGSGVEGSVLRELPAEQAGTSVESSLVEPTSSESAETTLVSLVLTLSERRLDVYEGDRISVSYPVAVGREGWLTPIGEFTVFQKQADPAWEHPLTGEIVAPGPQNPLGSRWIGFWTDGTNSIGFHGTPDESVIGSAVSHGCVRMRNDDVLALYDYIGMETPVTVLP
ncbi:MAG: L,D-transpeptidase [Cyanobacteria bacterium J06634_5]